MEEWIAENGSGPTLDNFNWLIDVIKGNDSRMIRMEEQNTMFRNLFQEYMTEKDLGDDWDSWLKEKDDAVQKQKTEEEKPEEEEEE